MPFPPRTGDSPFQEGRQALTGAIQTHATPARHNHPFIRRLSVWKAAQAHVRGKAVPEQRGQLALHYGRAELLPNKGTQACLVAGCALLAGEAGIPCVDSLLHEKPRRAGVGLYSPCFASVRTRLTVAGSENAPVPRAPVSSSGLVPRRWVLSSMLVICRQTDEMGTRPMLPPPLPTSRLFGLQLPCRLPRRPSWPCSG